MSRGNIFSTFGHKARSFLNVITLIMKTLKHTNTSRGESERSLSVCNKRSTLTYFSVTPQNVTGL